VRSIYGWALAAGALAISGCSNSYTPTQGPLSEKPPAERVDELFAAEGTEEGMRKTAFRTNNERYWTLEGATVWTVWGEEEEFADRTVKMGKSVGYAGGGYGIVFCQGEYEIEGKPEPAMLVAMVNNEGDYIIGKAVGGVFTDLGWWKKTPYLQRGAGAVNEIRVSYENGNSEYRLEINGYFIERFRDDNEPALRGGKNGYIVVITPFDKFPETGIDVYFMEEG
jgi:hypothetical protein